MANFYLDSSAGSATSPYDTRAKAAATMAQVIAGGLAAGDTVYVSTLHSESTTASVTHTYPGTQANPVRVICYDFSTGETPTASSTGGIIATGAGNYAISIFGSVYFEGIIFKQAIGGVSSTNFSIGNNGHMQHYRNCDFYLESSGPNSLIAIPATLSGGHTCRIRWEHCRLKCSAAGNGIELRNGVFVWEDGGVVAGGLSPTNLIKISSSVGLYAIRNLDLSSCDAAVNLAPSVSHAGRLIFSNLKMPGGWSGSIGTCSILGAEIGAYGVDAGDANYKLREEYFSGSIIDFSTLYLSGTDGIKHNTAAVPLSYKMTGSANAKFPYVPLNGMWRAIVNESTVAQTATIEIIHNESAALNNDEIWLELEYPAAAGSTQFTLLSDAKATVLSGAAAQATSTADWDDGLTERGNSTAYVVGNIIKSSGSAGSAFICTVSGTSAGSVPAGYTSATDGASITDGTATFKAMRRQKLDVPFTAAEQGVIRMRAVLAKAGAVVWVAAKVSVA